MRLGIVLPHIGRLSILRPASLAAMLCLAVLYFFATFPAAQAKPATAVANPPVIDIMASDYAFDAPDTLPAGLVTVRLMNHGLELHHAQFIRLNDDVTFQDFVAALQSEGESALRLTTLTGGAGAVDPTNTTEVTLNLTPGTYALACFVSSADGTPHLAKGMLKPITVTPADAPSDTLLSQSTAGTLTMRDFTFDIPSTLPAGPNTFSVVNDGPQPHELNILKLAPSAAPSDVLAWQPDGSSPPPFEAVGGMNGLSQGIAGNMTLDLAPGTYFAICNIPDPASGLPHSRLGMVRQFTVE
jgi:uncharacterized cupredoxin-like copper-binding protein